ncbi:MAG: cytidine deaminase [Firmicutes bacterium]|nr:cytidine deaminase [Bacillota bacterium]
MDKRELIELALAARDNSYCPYSGYSVGAALLTAGGQVFTGCNVENAGYSPTLCAERSAMAAAVSAGVRDFLMLAVAGGPKGKEPETYFWPCGVCRQWLAEFCPPDFPVITAKSAADYQETTLAELLPHAFSPDTLT